MCFYSSKEKAVWIVWHYADQAKWLYIHFSTTCFHNMLQNLKRGQMSFLDHSVVKWDQHLFTISIKVMIRESGLYYLIKGFIISDI